jgi:hypothetical protein
MAFTQPFLFGPLDPLCVLARTQYKARISDRESEGLTPKGKV